MEVHVQEAGACRKKLVIEIPAEDVAGEYAEVLATYAKDVSLPGFRKGRAPKALVEKRYGRDISEEVRERLIPKGYREALEQQSITPVAVLGVADVEFAEGRPLSFSVTLDVPPDITLPTYKGIPLKREKVDVSATEVDETLNRIRESRANYIDVTDRPVQQDDLVQVDFEAVCDGTAVEELAPTAKGLGQAEDFWVHAGENAFLPEFSDGLIGLNAGERGQVLVDFPADFHEAALAGKKATYFVHVKALKKKELPEFNEEFLKTLGVESEEVLRGRVEEDLRQAATSREDNRLKSDIVKHLLQHTDMDLPASVVEEETRNTIYDIVRQHSSRGVTQAQIEQQKDEIFEVAGRSAADKVKVRYIMNCVATEEKVEVAEDEVSRRVAAMAQSYGLPEEHMRSELEKKNMIEGIRDQVRVDKTLDLLLAAASITD